MLTNDRYNLVTENHIHMEMVLSFSFVRQAAGNTYPLNRLGIVSVWSGRWEEPPPVEKEMNPDGNTEHSYPSC